MTTAIRVDGLSKLYRRATAGHQLRTLKSALLERSLVRGLRREEAISALLLWALQDRAGTVAMAPVSAALDTIN